MRVTSWPLRLQALALLGALAPLRTFGSPAVNVALKASFSAPPFLVELLETAAEENSTAYYPILDRIAEGHFQHASTDKELYASFLQLLQDDGHITDSEALSSFDLALSIHSAAPRIEAHYQFYDTSVDERLDADCNTWAIFGTHKYCSPGLDDGKNVGLRTDVLPFDRLIGESTSTPSILYADITSSDFAVFHKALSSMAKDGKTQYRLRHKPSSTAVKQPLTIHGYGVELALKRTDYIVIDDRDADGVDSKHSQARSAQDSLDNEEEVADLRPLSSTELASLGLNAASFVLDSADPMDTLLKLSQDFPKHSSAIASHNTSKKFLFEHRRNRDVLLPAGYNVLWINGAQYDPRTMDAFSLLEHLRKERKLINGLRDLGFTGKEAIEILSHPAVAEAQASIEPQRYDFRDETEGGNVIIWMNDIEKDKRYEDWPVTVKAFLQRVFPGQLPPVRKDAYNVIVPIDFTDKRNVAMIAETLQAFVKRKIPVRWGLVPNVKSKKSIQQAKIIYHLLDNYGLAAVMAYLQEAVSNGKVSTPDRSIFEAITRTGKLRRAGTARSFEEAIADAANDERLEGARKYLSRLAAEGPNPPILVNGIPVARNEEWLQAMSHRVGRDLQIIQRAVFEELIDDNSWIPSIFLANAAHRRNPLVIPEDETSVSLADIGKLYSEHGDALFVVPHLKAEPSGNSPFALLLVVADFDAETGFNLFREAVEFHKDHPNVEIRFVHNAAAPLAGEGDVLGFEEILKTAQDEYKEGSRHWATLAPFKMMSPLIEEFGLRPGQQGLLLNGRFVGPIPRNQPFTKVDFETLFDYESKKRVQPAITALRDLGLEGKVTSPFETAKFTSLVSISSFSDVPEGIFESTSSVRIAAFNQWNTEHTAIVKGDMETSVIQIVASIDPASEIAQRWVPILKVLSELSGVHTRLFLNPKETLDGLPVKRFYRYVLDANPSFDENGSLASQGVQFKKLPEEALLTMGLDVPAPWLVAPKECVHDLDNIKLGSIKGDVDAIYELENILIEGHSRDVTTGKPPRGAQLVLGTAKDPHFADTIIMANLGYFQFKANPGLYKIALKSGRSEEIFNVDSIGAEGHTVASSTGKGQEILLMSFRGLTMYPRLSRKPGKEIVDVLEIPKSTAEELIERAIKLADTLLSKAGLHVDTGKLVSQGSKFLGSLRAKAGDGALETHKHADINIFSVASGHLYERMLNIMMVSVMKHTNHTVKFWFIEQFLSPSFKSFLPHLAAEYGFEYQMVTYKWPHWLRQQKEKQREIWGYKILFLDVLFPLDLDKVIFVDADQIVRTDMYELVTLDLHGAPYGFTPMCDSRTEMEGFRFWKQGYWKNFLRGLPYHISALYVVDLQRFRQIAAGDRLRQQYHQLSADPQSLSNLDQDLPNNMQMYLPIHSLPQEWLWCETWCADEDLAKAKTIDLCNNPMTKEPKLDRARRQVPEWTVYDEEIAALARRVRGQEGVAGGSVQEVEDRGRAAGSDEGVKKGRDEL